MKEIADQLGESRQNISNYIKKTRSHRAES
ncbi:hypothetical protein NF868_03580 [Bacillus zhangzhouensis]|nr:hypothetical protein NF868_03580 [Bacillus zhangzhouensis]